ncbi:MAG: amino acid racemase [Candidatus Komeilibacteria bacterium]|nr:amino acid racemase [Candidatus Komeilibacteria bacterium]
MKRVGILGGLGPETTAEFYLDLIRLSSRKRRPDVGIESLPLDLQKESEYISLGSHRRHYLRLLRRGACRLTRTECDFIVIPCNTVHEFYPQIVQSAGAPIVNLIDVVAKEVEKRGWQQVTLLATSRTIQTRLYQKVLARAKIEVRVPCQQDQVVLDQLIQGLVGDNRDDKQQQFLEQLIAKAGAKNIVLGCTDLQLLFPASSMVIDSMAALVEYTARLLYK